MSRALLQLWEYQETVLESAPEPAAAELCNTLPVSASSASIITEEEVAERVQQAVQAALQRQAAADQAQEVRHQEQLQATLRNFRAERSQYFRDAEAEVVHLALAIARKILHREAQLDPDLLAALVRIALERIGAEPAAKLRVAPAHLSYWQRSSAETSPASFEVCADDTLAPGECLLETSLGTASIGLEAQFKQIEQGMLDLLRLRPTESTSAGEGEPC